MKIMCRTRRLTPSKLDWKEKVIIIYSFSSYDKTLSSVATLKSIRILLALFTSCDLQNLAVGLKDSLVPVGAIAVSVLINTSQKVFEVKLNY